MSMEALAKELIFKKDLDFFCQLINENNIPFLIWKGSALAYEVYPDPLLRPRVDTDVLIPEHHKQKLFTILKEAGYFLHPNQHEILGQVSFSKKINQLTVIYDVHWEIFAQQSLKNVFHFEELWQDRKKLAQIPAYTVCDPMALVLSSVHWVAHHYSQPEPHWVSDIQRLSAQRSTDWWKTVQTICEQKKMSRLQHAVLKFSQVPSPWREEDLPSEPLAYLLSPQRDIFRDFWQDWKTQTHRQRVWTLTRHLFPESTYMRFKYNLKSDFKLPFYYGYRIFKGLAKILKTH